MAVEDSVADDMIAAFVDRILRLKAEADDIAADIKEIYAEAHGNGFNKTRLGEIVTYLRKVEKDASKVEEAEAIRDLYLTAYYRAKNKPHAYARARGGNSEPEHDPETGEITEPQEAQAPAQAVPDDAPVASVPVESIAAEISTPITDSQPAPQAESDLTDPEPSGQVAPIPAAVECPRSTQVVDVGGSGEAIQPETANEIDVLPTVAAEVTTPEANTHGQTGTADNSGLAANVPANAEAVAKKVGQSEQEAPVEQHVDTIAGSSNGRTAAFDADNAGSTPAPASSYVPGVVMEMAPFRPATRPHYHDAFPEILGKDFAALVDSIREEGVREPIIRMGDVILDGWARYNAARTLGIAYPVQDYSGSDPLLDVVRMQCRSRQFSAAQERVVAGKLAKAVPHRADEIMEAFGLAEELAEAE